MGQKLLKAMPYVCAACAIFFQIKKLFYATEMRAYTETAFVFLVVAFLFVIVRLADSMPE